MPNGDASQIGVELHREVIIRRRRKSAVLVAIALVIAAHGVLIGAWLATAGQPEREVHTSVAVVNVPTPIEVPREVTREVRVPIYRPHCPPLWLSASEG